MWLDDLHIHAPELQGEWLNSPPLALRGLRGRVVLVDFWDFTCINCLRTLPYVTEWHRRYEPHGLTILGVHTPEFHFATEPALVARAVHGGKGAAPRYELPRLAESSLTPHLARKASFLLTPRTPLSVRYK